MNVWPKLSQMWSSGVADGYSVGIALFWAAAVVIMALCPIAFERARKGRVRAGSTALCAILASLTFSNAVDVAGKVRDSGAAPARELIAQAAGLDSRIADAEKSRSKLPQAPPAVTTAMVKAAQDAVDAAEIARAQECGKVADNCRLRVADKKQVLADQAELLARKAITDDVRALEAEIKDLKIQRQKLGHIPDNADPTLQSLARFVGLFMDLGPKPAEVIAEWWPTWVGFGVEALALLGPFVLIPMFVPDPERAPRRWLWPWRWRKPEPEVSAAAPPPPVVEAATLAQTPATPALRKKRSKIKAATVRESGNVREWRESRTVARANSKVKPSDAHNAYKTWCIENGKEPVTLTAFGTTMKGELGVVHEERNNRGFYVGIALVGAPKLVAVGMP